MKEHITYTVIKSSRTTISIQISKDGVVIVRAPKMMNAKQIEAVVQKKWDWIVKKQTQILEQTKNQVKKDTMSFLGEAYQIEKIPHANFKKPVVSFTGSAFVIHGSEKDDLAIRDAFILWYKNKAREIFTERSSYYATLMQVSYRELRIKDQKTCFGSCSSKRNLNFNYRVIMAPLQVVDYLVIHELCHLKQMNHSKAFWAEVEKMQPNYKENRKWLMNHASSLVI